MKYTTICCCIAAAVFAFAEADAASSPYEVRLAAEGKPLLRVVVAESASPQVAAAAKTLADYLGRLSGARFDVAKGDGREGIAVGVAGDFPDLKLASLFDAPAPAGNEQYVLHSHTGGVWAIGATDFAVEHAVWDLLYRLGYRHFFPGAHWEIIPQSPDLRLAVEANEVPDYYSRKIWYGWGNWRESAADKVLWDARNRMGESVTVNSGHAYESIISANQAEFDKHPEYLCSPKSTKFRISSPGLRKLVVDYALNYFKAYPDRDSISLEPSDGGGWDCPEDEKAFSNITDRVVTLANTVAEALQEHSTNKFVGMYAYYQHSPPPTIRVHSNVVVSIATSFIQGGYTIDDLFRGWGRQGAQLGVRDYYSVVVGHKDRPGGPGASNPRAIGAAIPRVYNLGARLLSAESSDSWGPAGLGYYVASRLTWNTKENVEALIDDFFSKAFGPAEVPMREFYRIIDGSNKPMLSKHLVGMMYRQLDAARQLTRDPGIRSRLDDLTLYTRYVELLRDIKEDPVEVKNEPQADDVLDLLKDDNGSILAEPIYKADGTERVLSFAYRIRSTHMVHSLALWRDTRGFRAPISIETWSVPEGKNPWKSSKPFDPAEIEGFISAGITSNPVATFTPVAFSEDLVPAVGPLNLKTSEPGQYGYTRTKIVFFVWLDAPGTLHFDVRGGQTSTNGAPKATLTLYPLEDPMSSVASTGQAPLDMQTHPVELTSAFKGMHRLELSDAGRCAGLVWPPGTRVSIPISEEHRTLLRGRVQGSTARTWKMYFYVPKGTRVVGGYTNQGGTMFDGAGKVAQAFAFKDRAHYFSVPVPPGQDGKLWSLSGGHILLMTVPPYLARSAEELLLPKEVVEADAPPKAAGP